MMLSHDTPDDFWDGCYNHYSTEDESDFAYVAHSSSPSSPDYVPQDFSSESSSESNSDVRANRVDSEAGSNGEAVTDAKNDEDACDRVCNEEDMLSERGWGSEEDDEPRLDRYPIFRSSKDMEDVEIIIGREFESFAQFKEFFKVNAVRSRRGVKFSVNDKVRCKFKMMKRITVNFIKVASRDSESLCPQAYETIKERKKLACMCYPTFNGNGMFEVREGLRSWVVDVRASQCACGLWQLSGLPCEHVLACITYNRDPIEPYCDPCYTIVNYRLAYGNSINPLNDAT
ncbi:hypothetical protein LINPERPRIM_LOCUS14431 [Linum perenne]